MSKPASPPWPLNIQHQQPEVSFVTPEISMRKAAVAKKPIVELIDEDEFEEQQDAGPGARLCFPQCSVAPGL